MRAVRVRSGWRLDGTAPWCTGWGITDMVTLAAATADGSVVFVVVPAEPGPQVRAGEPQQLAAVTASRTVALELDGLVVEDDDVVLHTPYAEWALGDRRTTVNLVPAVLGVTAAAVAGLRRTAEQRDVAVGLELADSLDARLVEVRMEVSHLLDDVDPDAAHDERLAARAAGQRLALDATAAYVTASGGAGMALSHEAQRLARGALFLTVQAQTAPARDALLRSLLASRPRRSPR